MAGEGKRFKEAGYKRPKPLVEVDKVPMIQRVYNNLAGWANFIFVVNPLHEIWKLPHLKGDFYETEFLTEGPACTALLASRRINNDNPLIIANCDQVVLDYDFHGIETFAAIHDADVILGCFISSSPKNSYVRLNDDGQIIEVREKEVISNIATNGLHWFRRGSDFVRGAEKMIEADDRVNGEFYIAPSVNYLIAEGLKVMPFFFNLHFPIGTPEDLQKYEAIHSKTNQ